MGGCRGLELLSMPQQNIRGVKLRFNQVAAVHDSPLPSGSPCRNSRASVTSDSGSISRGTRCRSFSAHRPSRLTISRGRSSWRADSCNRSITSCLGRPTRYSGLSPVSACRNLTSIPRGNNSRCATARHGFFFNQRDQSPARHQVHEADAFLVT